jgi:hypothetical protein
MTDAPWQSLGPGDFVRDYRHAARIFGSNDFIRAPKSKYLFYVVITTNPAAIADNFGSPPNFKSELSYLVKNVELPKFEIEVQEHNQYNRKVLAQRQIKYNPVTIKFHDDNDSTLRDFWQTYYNYYFMDGRYTDSDFKKDDKYQSRTAGTSNRWGIDTNAKAPYLTKIDIYSFYHGKGDKITLESPMITSFNHDSHDYSENIGVMEATMSVRYTGVRYEQQQGVDAANGIPGFGQAAPEAYDTEMSSLVNGTGTDIINDQGNYATSVDQGPVTNFNPLYALQNAVFNSYNPTVPGYITNQQLAAVLNSTSKTPVNTNYVFPSYNPLPVTFQDYGALNIQGSVATTDGKQVLTPSQVDSLYVNGSWQQNLFQKGYSPDQINAANNYIKTATLPTNINIQSVAETYLKNATSPKLADYGKPVFGQPAKNSTNINFSNPTTSTQSVYNGQDWQYKLAQQGYTPSDISSAERFLSQLKVSSSADLTTIASNYINRSKGSGLIGVSKTSTATASTSTLTGPNFNPSGTSGTNPYTAI